MTALKKLAAALVVAYAFLAGYHDLGDPDMWWQMSAARYLTSTGHIARTEVFSYTAQGAPWIYPQGAGLLFNVLYNAGGAPLLASLSAVLGAGIALLLVSRGGWLRITLAMFAVPVIAIFTAVRANMFTVLFAAVFLAVLYPDERAESRKLWLLPPLMLLWVNLHPGFLYGVLLVFGFAVMRRGKLIPVAAATLFATLVNPWGHHVYEGIVNQNISMPVHRAFITEWARTPVSLGMFWDALRFREHLWGAWWILGIAPIAILCGFWRKRATGPLLLAVSMAAAISAFRLQGLFMVAAVIVIPDLLPEIDLRRFEPAMYCALIAFTGWCGFHMAHDKTLLNHVDAWVPERAANFVQQHHLPRELYHDYVTGGYLGWRLAPQYPVFIDGRALPFGDSLLIERGKLGGLSPDSPQWKATFEKYHIHTLLILTERNLGYGGLPLAAACNAKSVKLVYLDETAAVFVTTAEVTTPVLDCKTAQLPPPPAARPFEYWAGAARLYLALDRVPDAEHAISEARKIYDRDAQVQLELAALRKTEPEYKRLLDLSSGSGAYEGYAGFLMSEGRFNEGRLMYEKAVARSLQRHDSLGTLAQASLLAGRPKAALAAADEALAASPFVGAAEASGVFFTARMEGIRGEALLSMLNLPAAVTAFEKAVRIAPYASPLQESLYVRLADAYYQSGRSADAQRAMSLTHQHSPSAEKHLEWLLSIKQ